MKVILKNLAFFSHHGLYEFETKAGGDFLVDVEVTQADKTAYMQLADVVNYETLFQIVERRMNEPKHFIEEVARLILADVKSTFPELISAKVTLTKCAPPIANMKGQAVVVCEF
jgi:dihydroneopterin aldolase